ncbi:MAG: InlB B-repeat-containing protein, partial [Prevotella sp.]|nr:InlB B-repeat-containing protein [Prevotella sp.]
MTHSIFKRATMMLLATLFSTMMTWADNVTLSYDETNGYYAYMSATLNATRTLTPTYNGNVVQEFTVKTNGFSKNSNMIIKAPAGYFVFNIKGYAIAQEQDANKTGTLKIFAGEKSSGRQIGDTYVIRSSNSSSNAAYFFPISTSVYIQFQPSPSGNYGGKLNLEVMLSPIIYYVAFDGNGATGGEMSNQRFEYDKATALTANGFTRTGYTFAGWSTTANGEVAYADQESVQNLTTTGDATITLYAQWTPITYNITYNLAGGTVATANPTTYTIESEAITLVAPTRTGCTFDGWTGTGLDASTTDVTIAKGSTGDRSYTATWTLIPYAITYNLNGGTNADGNPATYTVETSTFTLDAPTRTGYTFDGWYSNEGCTEPANTTIDKGSTGDRTFYAKWTPTTYNITYNLAGGTVATANPTTYTIESEAITLVAPTRTGYTFDGWTGTGLDASTTDVTIAKGSTGDRSYTATWTPITYTITYNLNGGTNADGNPATYTIETSTFTLDVPTRTGYTFDGWYSNEGCTEPANKTIEKGSIGDRTFYAKWTPITYIISFDANHEDVEGSTASVAATYNEDVMLTANGFTLPGYIFSHWNTQADGSGISYADEQSVSNLATETDATVILYAQWVELKYTMPLTLEFVADGTLTLTNLLEDMQYSTDGGVTKTTIKATYNSHEETYFHLPVSANTKIQLYGKGKRNTALVGTKIKCSADCYIYGNIMSLVDEYGFATNTTLTAVHMFCGLFQNNTHLKNHATEELLLPATELKEQCYYDMFSGCTSLTKAPKLPATTLANNCYAYMFSGCTSLTIAPELNATTLAGRCYANMFSGCTSLTTAPELPATELEDDCYVSMFKDCVSLQTAPALPATVLKSICYTDMFFGCTSLNHIEMMATDIDAQDCLCNWVHKVADKGVFVKNSAAQWNVTGESGIPSGWTVLSINPDTEKTYDINLGEGIKATIVCDDSQSSEVDFAPNGHIVTLSTLEGYTFSGSYTVKDADNNDVIVTDNQFTMPAKNVTVTASLTPINYIVKFDANGGTGSVPADMNMTYGEAQAIPENILTHGDDVFMGWCTTPDGTGTFYIPGGSIKNLSTTANASVTLYGLWKAENAIPLTLEAVNEGITIILISNEIGSSSFQYAIDGGEKQDSPGAVFITKGQTVQLYGYGTENTAFGDENGNHFLISCSADCYIYGNIMSLVDEYGFATNTTLTAQNTFSSLFQNNIHLRNHATKELLLPATELKEYCYYGMFSGCTSLTKAPKLPATTLAVACYANMFSGCTSLTKAPKLPAT